MTEACSNCRYSHPTTYPDSDKLGFECRWFPPQLASAVDEDGELAPWQAWPIVKSGDWCGQWRSAEQPIDAHEGLVEKMV